MRKFLCSIVLTLCVASGILLSGGEHTIFAADIEPEAVNRAIEIGVIYLKAKQLPEGNWEEHLTEPGGKTALCVIALLSAGVPKNDRSITRAMQYLRQLPLTGDQYHNYALALQTMAFSLCDPERDRPLIRRNVLALEQFQIKSESGSDGGWTYDANRAANSDNSNAQFSMLALYEAEKAGVPAKRDTWQRARRYWERTQNDAGSWGYNTPGGKNDHGSGNGTGSMTCAGISSLWIAAGMTGQGAAMVRGDRIVCSTAARDPIQARIQAGLSFLGNHFTVEENPLSGGLWHYYYLYGLERVGRMTAQRFIGKHDWYRAGTAFLLQRKGENGKFWQDNSGDVTATAFSLIFLSRGRWPVLMSKVEFGGDDSWNLHPHDVDHLTRYVESRWKQEMTWQVINLKPATAEDLLQSPVLYFCGTKSPLPSNEREAEATVNKLREYLNHGGFIVAEAQPNDESFDRGFRTLMRRVLPEEGYELRPLPAEHPIWHAEVAIEPDQLRPIEGITYGCRTSVVYCRPTPYDNSKEMRPSLSCLWEVARLVERDDPYPAAVDRQIEAGLGIGINILAYATFRELKTKDQKMLEAATASLGTAQQRRGRIRLGLLERGSGTDSAPRAIPNLLQWAELSLGIQVDVQVDRLTLMEDTVFDFPILFMHGRGAFELAAEERDRLRRFAENGGTLFVNAICSSPPFTESFREAMKKVFPENQLEKIPPDDPLLSDAYDGFKIDRLNVQSPRQNAGRQMLLDSVEIVPDLYGIKIEDRWAVIFSPLDVSCALEKTSTLDCRGYQSESALKLAINVILYALEHQ